MDPTLRTVIGHRGMRWCNPLGWVGLGELHDALHLRSGARLLDLCCGKGALLTYLLDWTPDATGTGVDLLPAFVEEARSVAAEEGVEDRVTFEVGDARSWQPRRRGFDVVACVGARPWGSRHQTLAALVERARPGGCVVFGDLFWRRPPEPEYLEHLGCDADEHTDLHGTLDAADLPLDLEWWIATRPDQHDEYERRYLGNLLAHARSHPRDEQARVLAEGARRWRDGHLRWGRQTLGFTLAMWRVRPAS